MRRLYLIPILALISTFACKVEQSVSEETPQNKTAEEPAATEVSAPIEPWSEFGSKEAYERYQQEQQKEKMRQEMGIQHPEYPDSMVVAMERTACFGSCPSYKFSISKNGYAYYKGMAFVENEGEYKAKVSQELISSILEAAEKSHYYTMKEFYWEPITDVPSTYTSVLNKGERFNRLNQSEAPQELIDFELFLDDIIKEINWTKIAK